MAAPTTTDAWDEYVMGLAQGSITQVDTWRVGLYDDSTDTVVSTDTGDPDTVLTTIPSGSGYADKSITPSTDASLVVGTDTSIDIVDQTWSGLSFGVATSVDAFYVAITVQLDGDGAATEHLMAVGTLSGGPYDLQNYTSFTVQDMGVTQTQA